MKLPLCWLKDFAEIGNSTPEQIAEALLKVGFEVEEIIFDGAEIENVVVGKVIDCKPHANSDHLHVCMVDVSSEILQIVCGAPNVEVGDVVPVALEGAKLPGGIEIKPGDLRGVMSYGMLCSGKELGVDDTVIEGAEVDGLLQLPVDTPLGTNILDVLGKNEYVLDVSVTANRPDCQSIVGLAREVAASMGVKFTPPVNKYKTIEYSGEYVPTVKITSDICSRYTGRLIKDVKIKQSPKWMRDRLRLVGVRPINNIVDITNYVLFEIGQPLHSFDLRFIDKGIIVRTANKDEKITALDGKEYVLSDDMLVIADEQKPIAIAGVMGGEYSGIMDDTATVFLEAARFERRSIRVTSRKLGLRSDSSARYEKGVDYQSVDEGRERALALIYQLKAGKIVNVRSDDGIPRPKEKVINTTAEQICSIIGIDIEKSDIEKILTSLDFKIAKTKGDDIVCTVPLFREDIEDFADLSEEVIRYYGYDNLKPTFLKTAACTSGGQSSDDKRMDDIKNILCGKGAFEIMTYSFINEKASDMLKLNSTDARRKVIKLKNPLNEDTAVMRTQLAHSMLTTISLNQSRGNDNFRLFELGRIYIPEGDDLPKEKFVLSIGLCGKAEDFYTAKDIAEAVIGYFTDSYDIDYGKEPYLHPGISACVSLGDKFIGSFGEVHPTVCENYGINGKCYIGELDITELLALDKREIKYKTISKYPCVNRDLAMVVADKCKVGDIIKAIKEACGENLEEVALFDVYKGEQIESGKKSLAFSLKFRSVEKTLGDSDIQYMMLETINKLKSDFEAELR